MAGETGSPPFDLEWDAAAGDDAARERAARWTRMLDALSRSAHQFDFFQAMRRLEARPSRLPDRPRFGEGLRPADEPLRLGQEPSLSFPASSLAGLAANADGPPRLLVNFFGLLGPNGPLPLHLTEYTRDRQRNADDPTMARFFDLFHHRMLMFFYRAWASGQPTVSRDLPATDRFELYVGALVALGLSSLRQRDALPDLAKLYYAGRLAPHHRNAEGLAAMAGDFFGVPARVQSFMGEWIDLPADRRWKLGADTGVGRLGMSSMLGARTWTRQQKFRLVLGPLDRGEVQVSPARRDRAAQADRDGSHLRRRRAALGSAANPGRKGRAAVSPGAVPPVVDRLAGAGGRRAARRFGPRSAGRSGTVRHAAAAGNTKELTMSEISRVALFGKLNTPRRTRASRAPRCSARCAAIPTSSWCTGSTRSCSSRTPTCTGSSAHSELDPARLAADLTAALDRLPRGATSISDFSPHIEEAIERGWVYGTLMFGDTQVRTGHLMVGVAEDAGAAQRADRDVARVREDQAAIA